MVQSFRTQELSDFGFHNAPEQDVQEKHPEPIKLFSAGASWLVLAPNPFVHQDDMLSPTSGLTL